MHKEDLYLLQIAQKNNRIKLLESELKNKVFFRDNLIDESNLFIDELRKHTHTPLEKFSMQDLNYNLREIKTLFKWFQKYCYDNKSYKWKVKQAKFFIERFQIKPDLFIVFVTSISETYFIKGNKTKGFASLKKFLHRLETSKSFKNANFELSKLNLKEDTNIYHFLNDWRELNKHLDLNHDQMVDLADKLFNTGYKKSHLRNLYMQK
ncbi:hypothetical protein [Christiangramia echinicola]|uniref:hypothetical protein n=1 Tax=Christiangramia echinicola TaxID=279359 RepID=UPI00040525DB|nr:hypothetical protein [Christiangramia echinicola]